MLITTGGRPYIPSFEGSELAIDSDGFFDLEEQPKKVVCGEKMKGRERKR